MVWEHITQAERCPRTGKGEVQAMALSLAEEETGDGIGTGTTVPPQKVSSYDFKALIPDGPFCEWELGTQSK